MFANVASNSTTAKLQCECCVTPPADLNSFGTPWIWFEDNSYWFRQSRIVLRWSRWNSSTRMGREYRHCKERESKFASAQTFQRVLVKHLSVTTIRYQHALRTVPSQSTSARNQNRPSQISRSCWYDDKRTSFIDFSDHKKELFKTLERIQAQQKKV